MYVSNDVCCFKYMFDACIVHMYVLYVCMHIGYKCYLCMYCMSTCRLCMHACMYDVLYACNLQLVIYIVNSAQEVIKIK